MEIKVLERAQRKPEELWAIEDLFASDQQCGAGVGSAAQRIGKGTRSTPGSWGNRPRRSAPICSCRTGWTGCSAIWRSMPSAAPMRIPEWRPIRPCRTASSLSGWRLPQRPALRRRRCWPLRTRCWNSSIVTNRRWSCTAGYLENLRSRRAHILSAAEEKLLAGTGEMAQTAQRGILHVL